jgi:hypothetical protein
VMEPGVLKSGNPPPISDNKDVLAANISKWPATRSSRGR